MLRGIDIEVNYTILILKIGTCEEEISICNCHCEEKWWYVYGNTAFEI